MNYLLQVVSMAAVWASVELQVKAEEFHPHTPQPVLLSQQSDRAFEYEDFDFWVEQCLLLSGQQQYAEALAACEQAIALEPREDNVDLWAARGNALLHLGQYADAIASYRRVVEASPNHSLAIASQCAALFQLNRYEDAIATCEQALSIDGNWGNVSPAFAWYYRGLALRQLGRLETALSSFERAVAVDANHLPSLAEQCETLTELRLGVELSENCSPSAAVVPNGENTFSPAAENTPLPLIAQCGALPESDRDIELVINTGLQATVLCYERALADDSQNATLWIQQGHALEQLGQYDRAATAYDRAIALNPNQAIALVHVCGIRNQLQDYEAALEACDRAFQIDGGLATWKAAYGWNQRSIALLGLQRYDEALAAANQAIEIEQRYAPAWNSRALSLWWLNQGDAVAAIDQAINRYVQAETVLQETFERTYPDSPILIYRGHILALFNKGRILASLEKYDRAVQEGYDEALKLYHATRNDERMNALDRVTVSEIWANQAVAYLHWNFPAALSSTEQALAYNRDSFVGWYNRGLAFANLNDAECAFDAYSEAHQIAPNNMNVLIGQGLALERLGAVQDAIALFERILSLDATNTLAQQHREALVAQLWATSADPALQPMPTVPSIPVSRCRSGLVGR